MFDLSSSIWSQDEKGEWKLYFNNESDTSALSPIDQELKKSKINMGTKENKLILGTLVMTPKGIGRLIKIIEDTATIRFKEDEEEENFGMNDISNYINIFIYFFSKGNNNIYRLKLRVSGKVGDILTELENIHKINQNENSYSLIYGKNLLKNECTFEQLNLLNNSKFLITEKACVAHTVSRFININQFWYTYSLDGICFSSSKKIKLIGVGLFGSHENKTIPGTLRILEGPSSTSKIIIEENVEIPPSSNKQLAISKIYFKKPILCKKDQDYSVVLNTRVNSNIYYGSNGKQYIVGEKGVTFSFKNLIGKTGGTVVQTGNFPEFYYYLH